MTMNGEYPRVGHVVDPGTAGLPVEDAVEVVALPFGRLLVLADALPGATPRGGAAAVDALVRYLAEARLDEALPEAVRNLLFQAFQAANQALLSAPSQEGFTGMAASLVAALIVDERAYVASAGVGRLFLVRDGRCVSVTREPMPMPEGEEPPPLPPGAVSGVAASPLGLSQEFVPEILPTSIRFQAGDALVLASDGLLDVVGDDDIARVAVDGPAEVAAIKLVELARQRRSGDNVSVVLFQHSPLGQQTVNVRVPASSTDDRRRKLQFAAIGGVLLFLAVALLLAAPWKKADPDNFKPVESVGTPAAQAPPQPAPVDAYIAAPIPAEEDVIATPEPVPEPKVVERLEPRLEEQEPAQEEEKLELEPPVPIAKPKEKKSASPAGKGGGKASAGGDEPGGEKGKTADKGKAPEKAANDVALAAGGFFPKRQGVLHCPEWFLLSSERLRDAGAFCAPC